jgi:sugar phosphate isomerase/epimerase
MELRLIVAEVLRRAADQGVNLLLKPECTHVLASIEDAVRLREDLAVANLGFVMDPANFLIGSPPDALADDLRRLCDWLGPWTPLVHAKDLRFDPQGTATPPVGQGTLDYGLLFRCLSPYQPAAPVILEHLRAEEIAGARALMEQALGR